MLMKERELIDLESSKYRSTGVRKPGFESLFGPGSALWPRVNHLPSLDLTFLVC